MYWNDLFRLWNTLFQQVKQFVSAFRVHREHIVIRMHKPVSKPIVKQKSLYLLPKKVNVHRDERLLLPNAFDGREAEIGDGDVGAPEG